MQVGLLDMRCSKMFLTGQRPSMICWVREEDIQFILLWSRSAVNLTLCDSNLL